MNSSENKIHEIHEFSTGIQFEQRGDSWIWTGFTIKYMNSTLGEEIPKVVERSIANEEFALAEGSSTEKPAIIARILGSGDDIWSVVAVVTRGRDEVGRSAAFHRYFLCRGDHNLRVILAWWEQNNRPTFNPLDKQDEGNPHIFEGEVPKLPDLEQILPLFKVQTKPQEEQRLSSSSQSAQEAVLTWGTWGVPGQSGETRVIKEGIFPLSEEPVSTPESQNVEEYSLFQQLSPIVLEPNVQYDLYTINVLAINKWNSCKNGLPVCWAFDVEALVKPERFQVIKPASQKARDGINRAIAAGSRVVRNAVNIDEAALKSALRSLANSSQVKPESVETIINGLNNKDVTREYWHSLFNAQGTDRAIKEKIYSPQFVRLMTLRALVIPETLPEFLQWLNIQKGSNVDGNQRVSLELQKKIQPLFSKEQIGAGITYLLPSLLGGKISVDGLCWLLAKSGGDTIWAYGRNQFINNIKYDLQLIYNYYSKPIVVGLFDESTLKCKAEVWRSLINRWRDIRGGYNKCEEYRPLAQLFERFKEYDLAVYFYQVSDGVVKKDLFYEIPPRSRNLRLSEKDVLGLKIKTKLNLVDNFGLRIGDMINSFINFSRYDMKIPQVMIVSLVFFVSGLSLGNIFPIRNSLNEQTTVNQSKPSTNPTEEADVENVKYNWNKTTKAFQEIISDLSNNIKKENTPKIIKDLYPNLHTHIFPLISPAQPNKQLKEELIFSLILNEMNITQYQKFSYAKLGNITDEQKIKIYQAIKKFQTSNQSKVKDGYFDFENPKDTSLNKLKERVRQKI
ncbi:hypothetical protein [Cylindrospermopsis raciborskii]|uniref:Uncharacterized protein n=1 Tax=Cylindrospermopsis raciborskii CS-505 TaxID=533240 RepID=A0A853MG78_9CYAN|nr:hypothetical protein [Cylindrospermopsis raciborskii]OBU76276.1 hypothetical protein A9P98_08035 [Cylindrospermopsis raciborskii CS-505]